MPQKSINEIYTEHTRILTPEEEKRAKEKEFQASIESFSLEQKIEQHRIWLELPQTKDFLHDLELNVKEKERGFKNFGDNFTNEESLKSAGIQAVKLSVAIKQLTKIINYARTNLVSELH